MQPMPTSSFCLFFWETLLIFLFWGSFAPTAGGRQLFRQASCKSGQTFIIHHPLGELLLRKGHQKVDYSLDVSYSHPIKTTEMGKKKKTKQILLRFLSLLICFPLHSFPRLLDVDAVCVMPADFFLYFFLICPVS